MEPYKKPSIARAVSQALPKKRLELSEKQLRGLKTTAQIILAIGLVAGAISLAVLAPNALQLLKPFVTKNRTKEDRQRQNRKFVKSLYYLKQRGDIELIPIGKDFILKVTQKGRKKVKKLQFETLSIVTDKKWNKRWWLVLADIPSKTHRGRADAFRDKLKILGFYPLQRTVWVYPFDPRDEVDFVSSYYDLTQFVTVMEVSTVDPADEKMLVDFFREKI
ncbi:MAG: hypothetical protein HY545_02630 [Candidatus Doudnabacteria bacterium]|nr:hypothetical protein [Candidatus Doudnabacteria bacterium]